MIVEYTGRQTSLPRNTKSRPRQAWSGSKDRERREATTRQGRAYGGQVPRIAEVTMTHTGAEHGGACESAEMVTALRDALAKIEQQAVRQKQKVTTGKRHPKTGRTALSYGKRIEQSFCRRVATSAIGQWPRICPRVCTLGLPAAVLGFLHGGEEQGKAANAGRRSGDAYQGPRTSSVDGACPGRASFRR